MALHIPADRHLKIGILLFPDLDQLDLTGPFEVLSRVPNSTVHLVWKDRAPVTDMRGLSILPTTTLVECPSLDVVVVPGGFGLNAMMEDAEVLAFLRCHAERALYTASVCSGALVLGAAGLLKGRKATTHWGSFALLQKLGAQPVDARVVVDGNLVTCAGVTSGIDGALRLCALLRGDEAAQQIQLYMQYAPEPPFNAGSLETAPASVRAAMQELMAKPTAERHAIIARIASSL